MSGSFRINNLEIVLATVHLESRLSSAEVRGLQLQLIFTALRHHPHVILVGDFNFCSSWQEENRRIPSDYKDSWAVLKPGNSGYTDDTAVNLMRLQKQKKSKQVRFDRILYKSNHRLWEARNIEMLGRAPLSPELPEVFPSDHFGLKAVFDTDCLNY